MFMSQKVKRRNDRVIMAIGVVSILIGAYMILMSTFSSDIILKESKGLMLGHSALMVGGMIMMLHLPLHPYVSVPSEMEEMARDYGALVTAMLSVGLCFMLWGLQDMVSLGYTNRRMLCFLLGVIPLGSVLLTNSRTVEWMSVMWKVSMSLVVGLLILPFLSRALDAPQILFIAMTVTGNLLCIALVHLNEPYLKTYLTAREEAIRNTDGLFRSRSLYLAVTLALSVIGASLLLILYIGLIMDRTPTPDGFMGIGGDMLLEGLVIYGCISGSTFGWYLSACCLSEHCFDSSKYTLTVIGSVIGQVAGITAVHVMAGFGTMVALPLTLLISIALLALCIRLCRCCRSRRRSALSQDTGEQT